MKVCVSILFLFCIDEINKKEAKKKKKGNKL